MYFESTSQFVDRDAYTQFHSAFLNGNSPAMKATRSEGARILVWEVIEKPEERTTILTAPEPAPELPGESEPDAEAEPGTILTLGQKRKCQFVPQPAKLYRMQPKGPVQNLIPVRNVNQV